MRVALILFLIACGDGATAPADLALVEDLAVRDAAPPYDLIHPCVDGGCAAGLKCCGEVCVDVQSDAQNCGGCALNCTPRFAVPACKSAACTISMCDVGYEDCDGKYDDGCEVYTVTDRNNCGACGNVCPGGQHCAAGACVK